MPPVATRGPLWAFFAGVEEPRRQHATTWHLLETIRTITMLATICGAQYWGDLAHGGHAKALWLAACLDLTQGMPSPETFGRWFALRDSSRLQPALAAWMQALVDRRPAIVARDGPTLRRSLDRADGPGPMHSMPAWSAANALG